MREGWIEAKVPPKDYGLEWVVGDFWRDPSRQSPVESVFGLGVV